MTIPGDGEPVADVKTEPAWARRVTGTQAEDEEEDSSTGAQPETESAWSTLTFSRFPADSDEDDKEIPGGGVSNWATVLDLSPAWSSWRAGWKKPGQAWRLGAKTRTCWDDKSERTWVADGLNAWWKSGSDKAKFSTQNTEHYNIGGEEQEEGGRVPNSYPDPFSGDRDGPTIKEWQRAVDLWREGEGRRVPVSMVGPKVLKML